MVPLEKIRVKVFEADQKDVGRGRIRISDLLMSQMGISPGDIVELENPNSLNKTGCITYLLKKGDNIGHIIRIDGIVRRNLSIKIGEVIKDKLYGGDQI